MKKQIFILTLCLAAVARGQSTVATVAITNAPRTRYEALNLTPDTLLIKGSSTIGTLTDQIAYPVEIRAERVTDPYASNNLYAVSVRTTMGEHLQIDYIDYEELDAVIQGVQYISQANSTVTPLDNFETVIRTRSGLSIAKVGRGTKTVIAMTCGGTNCVRNQMAPFVLDALGKTLTEAKAKIDLVVASGQ